MWLVLFMIGEAEPLARGIYLFKVMPSLAQHSLTQSLSSSIWKLCVALAHALFRTLAVSYAALFGKNFRIAAASSTSLPLIRSRTSFAFLEETLTVLAVAFASRGSDFTTSSSIFFFAIIPPTLSYQHWHRVRQTFLSEQIRLTYGRPYLL